jgi:hypothetical protein
MPDIFSYQIELGGLVNENEINSMGPLQMTVAQSSPAKGSGAASTLFILRTDQSGLIGLLRHLHGQGFEFLTVNRLD